MAQISNCLKLISKLDERDQDALVARLDELQAQGVPAERAQIQAAIDVLAAVQRESSGSNQATALASKARASINSGVTDTPEFKRWFGESKVVDADGKPMVVYHGTAAQFSAFDPAKIGSTFEIDGDGFFFTNDRELADKYADAARVIAKRKGEQPSERTIDAYVSLQNPWVIYVDTDKKSAIAHFESGDGQFNRGQGYILQYARESGYDGVVIQDRRGLDKHDALVIAFEPEQIKSATGNNGTFDPADADITRSVARPAGLEIVEVDDGFDAMKDGKRIGRLRDNLPRGAAEQLDENASVDIVKVEPEFKGTGVGSALYDAFNEKHGGRIAPSGKTSPEAWALWKRKFPQKVDAFIEAEAGRIRDGADPFMIMRGITDKDVARRVSEAAGDVLIRSVRRNVEDAFRQVDQLDDAQNIELDALESSLSAAWRRVQSLGDKRQAKAASFTLEEIDSEIDDAIDGGTLQELTGPSGSNAKALRIQVDGVAGEASRSRARQPSEIFGRDIAPLAIKAYNSLSPQAKGIIDGWNVNWSMGQERFRDGGRDSAAFDEVLKAYEPVREKLRQAYGDTIPAYRGEKREVAESKSDRFLFSWTPMRDVATGFAINRRRGLPPEITQDQIDKQVESYRKTGIARMNGYKFIRRDPGGFEPDGPDYYHIYRGAEMITDGDDIARALQSDKEDRDEYIAELRESGKLYTAFIPVDAVAFIPVGSNLRQPELVAEYNPRKDEAQEVKFSKERTTRPEFFSQLQRSIDAVPDRLATMAAPQWKLWLDANAPKLGVKKDEIEWSGVKDYLDLRGKDKVTRDELVAYLADSGVRIEETVLGSTGLRDTGEMYVAEANDYGDEWAVFTEDGSIIGGTYESEGAAEQAMDQMNTEGKPTKYSTYTVPGGENYREVLITLPGSEPKPMTYQEWKDGGMVGEWSTKGTTQAKTQYKSSHWDAPNVIAHLRVDDRTDADGNKVLFLQELQSDWGQDGKKKGFGNDGLPPGHEVRKISVRNPLADLGGNTAQAAERYAVFDSSGNKLTTDFQTEGGALSAFLADGKRVPFAPFVTDTKAWTSLALKRAIMMAVEGGYDKIALITGDQAADLYDLSKQISRVEFSDASSGGVGDASLDAPDGSGNLSAFDLDGKRVIDAYTSVDKIEDYVGKEVARKLLDAPSKAVRAAGVGMRRRSLDGLDLKVGGEGMRAFYDQIIPQVARDVLKKLGGGQLQGVAIAADKDGWSITPPSQTASGKWMVKSSDYNSVGLKFDTEEAARAALKEKQATSQQPGFDITPAMREKVASGVPLFSKGRTASGAGWESPSASKFDELVYKFQDKQIETKRVVEAIKEASGALSDDLNVYLNEEMYHGRAAKRTEDFVNMELNPLIEDMAKAGMTIADLEEFLHARHAKEANAVIAQRNPGEPGLQDGGSGMTNSEADNYMATLPAADRKVLEAAANKVDAIIGGTRKMFVDYELESQATVNGWNGMFKHYVPLQREDKEGTPGLGQGFSIKGKETKGRTGSTRKVVDILANVAMQRERAIVRGEKNRVAQSLVGLVRANENPDFWLVDEVPTERVFNPATGLVEDRVDPMYKSRDNAVVAKIKDPSGAVREHAVLFNKDDPRALRMAQALKNLDAQQLNGLLGVSAKITRYFAAVNTQYNPVFGVVNLVRDVQGAMLNLSSTPLKDDKLKIAKYTASALAGIYGDMRAARKGKNQTSKWAALWDEFQEVGGQTGYRDLFATSADRADAIQKALDPNAWMDSKLGKVFTAGGALRVPVAQAQKQAGFLFDWLSDYNNAMENGVRLAAYKAGLERGMTKQQAASAAKNLTTNFNRKGQVAQQAGAMYAFFNAAIQGTARIGQTLFDMEPGKPKTLRMSATGKKIIYGGIVLGSVQAMALAAAGFSEEDPPEFTRERSLIIPTGNKTYVSIPMPLGMHIIPSIGRVATEFALSGFKDPIKRSIGLTAMFADAFNPIGNAGMSMQTLAPTALDPLVALTENRDWTGRPISKTSFNKATPGHALGRDTATALAEVLSESINTLSGGNKYVAGVFSPTPDSIDYLLGQLTGGVGREYSKTEQTLKSAVRGEALPTYKIPLVGRFIGNAKGQASEGSAFYANVDKLNEIETEAKGLRADGKEAEARKLLGENPEAYLITQANYAERAAQKLRRQKSELIKAGAPREQVKAVEEEITAVMARLNRAMERLKTPAESPQ